MTIYIAVDPGVVTGLGLWSDKTPLSEATFQEIDSRQGVRTAIKRMTASMPRLVIITEKFIISQRTIQGKVKYDSLYLNGWLNLEYPEETIEQTPAQAKGLVSDEMLKSIGWFTATKNGHANDAARHMVYRLVKDRNPKIIDALKEYVQ